jgi:hypothetical protein
LWSGDFPNIYDSVTPFDNGFQFAIVAILYNQRRTFMSRTRKGGKAPGYEYWSPRPGSNSGAVGKEAKQFTHRAERNANKREVERALRED